MVSAPVAAQVAEVRLGTSFDCARIGAGPSVPSLVCQTPELQLADVHQMQAYYALRHAQPERQQELRDQFNARIQGLVRECSTEQRRASGSQPSCVVRAFGDLHSFWFEQLQQTGNAAAVEEARHPASHFVGAQHALKAAGFLSSDASVDGVFGSGSRQAIARFQSGRGIPATGFLTSATADALMSLSAEQTRASATTRQPGTGSPSANPPMVLVQGSQAPSSAAEIHAIVQRHFIDAFARCWRLDRGLPDHNIEIRIVLDASAIVREVRPPRQGVPRDPVGRILYEQARRALLDPACYPIGITLPRSSSPILEFSMYYTRQGLTGIENFVERMTDGERAEYGRRLARAEADANQREALAVAETSRQREQARQREISEQERRREEQAQQERFRQELEMAQRAQEEQVRRNIREANDALRVYQDRPKTLLEQVMNYTSFAQPEGISIGETTIFWVSGHNGTHRCILTRMTAVNEQRASGSGADPFTTFATILGLTSGIGIGSNADRLVDIREFSDQGFRIHSQGGQISRVGDERRQIAASPAAVMDRLQNAWGLAFRECPGRRSAF